MYGGEGGGGAVGSIAIVEEPAKIGTGGKRVGEKTSHGELAATGQSRRAFVMRPTNDPLLEIDESV